jgi:peptidoglycan/LPS O-acetylase OafA/YrhL
MKIHYTLALAAAQSSQHALIDLIGNLPRTVTKQTFGKVSEDLMSRMGIRNSITERAPRIVDRAAGRDNNFNLLRMLAAIGVLISHAYPISLGPAKMEPLSDLLGVTLGTVCVMIFFTISGFFITRSFEQKHSLRSFLQARALRLFPALVVVLAATVIISALFLTVAPSKMFWPAAGEYLLRNLLLFSPKYPLPGVFEANPVGPAINGSLWTLNYEVMCYFGVVLCGVLGLLRRPAAFALGSGLLLALYATAQILPLHDRIENLVQLALPFAIGMSFWVWRSIIPLSWPLAGVALVAAVLLRPTPVFSLALVLALAYWVFMLGYARIQLLRGYTRLGDYSYGTYIYAFPIQQLVAFFGVVSPLTNIGLAFPAVLLCAVLSWVFVESPALRLRGAPNVRHPHGFR